MKPVEVDTEVYRQPGKKVIISNLAGKFDNADPAEVAHMIEGQERWGTTLNFRLAGEMCLVLALSDGSDDERLVYLDRARRDWERSVDIGNLSANRMTSDAGVAAVRLACLPIYSAMLLTDKIPHNAISEKVYKDLIDVQHQHGESIRRLTDRNRTINEKRSLIGTISEINVLLMLQRQGLRMADQSWAAAPTLFSEDNAASNTGRWDISVFSQAKPGSPIEVPYKIQVKTHEEQKRADRKYDEDISIVYAKTVLALKGRVSVHIDEIANECASELRGDSQATKNLNIRFDNLMEVIDP